MYWNGPCAKSKNCPGYAQLQSFCMKLAEMELFYEYKFVWIRSCSVFLWNKTLVLLSGFIKICNCTQAKAIIIYDNSYLPIWPYYYAFVIFFVFDPFRKISGKKILGNNLNYNQPNYSLRQFSIPCRNIFTIP
jgi:hypothetical protein